METMFQTDGIIVNFVFEYVPTGLRHTPGPKVSRGGSDVGSAGRLACDPDRLIHSAFPPNGGADSTGEIPDTFLQISQQRDSNAPRL